MNPDGSVLQELRSLLKPPIQRLKGLDYSAGHCVYREIISGTVDGFTSYLSDKICKTLDDQEPGEELNICSVGCGDGEVDFKILSKVTERFPHRKVHLVGIDINEKSCHEAEKNLSNLPYKTTIINEGFLEVDSSELPKFDLVFITHAHYHFPNLKNLFSKAVAISREGNGKIEVISDRRAPMWCLTEIFDFDVQFTDSLLKELKMMNLNSSIQCVTVPGKADFSRCVAEDFTSQYTQHVLNFFCQSNLGTHPPEVTTLCVKYIKSCLDEKGCCNFSTQAITLSPIQK